MHRARARSAPAVRFININTTEPEFCEWRWLEPRELVNLAVPFKRDVYDDVLKAFSSFV